MPMFEYICTKCNNKFEELVFGNTKVKCPGCGSDSVEKLVSTFCATVAASGSAGGSPSGGSSGFS